ncbi:MAG: hypothetical protein PHS41_04415 [Victivallaceae bacterium]|nr:hypothetical protein [Victivallaceae bacterium]
MDNSIPNVFMQRALALMTLFTMLSCPGAPSEGADKVWKKGALHTHTLWSDGRSLPEVAVKTYQNLGYDFVTITDHNIFPSAQDVWLPVTGEEGAWPCSFSRREYQRSLALLPGKIQTKQLGLRTFVRLKPLSELRRDLEIPGRFLVIGGEEVTVMCQPSPKGGLCEYHMNTFHLEETLPALGGSSPSEVLRRNYECYQDAAKRAKEPSFLMLNHPFWRRWDVDARALIDNAQFRFFEICNNGSTEKIPDERDQPEAYYDFILAHRCAAGKELLYAVASDDAHFYDPKRIDKATGCDHGWVMVKCPGAFTAKHLAEAFLRGDFYSSCGVSLESVNFDSKNRTLHVKVQAEPGVKYQVRFLTTKRDFDRSMVEKDFAHRQARHFRRLPVIPKSIGQTVLTVNATEASYSMTPEDLYVRAIIVSDRPARLNVDCYPKTERAWTQPYR